MSYVKDIYTFKCLFFDNFGYKWFFLLVWKFSKEVNVNYILI